MAGACWWRRVLPLPILHEFWRFWKETSHVARDGAQINPDRRRKAQHGSDSMAASTARKVSPSTPL